MDNRILDKLDELVTEQARMNAILAVQAEQLKAHMARTDALEALVQLHYEELHDEVTPIKNHVTMLRGAAKTIGVISAVVALILSALKLVL